MPRVSVVLLFAFAAAWAVQLLAYVTVPARSIYGTHNALFYSAAYMALCALSAWACARIVVRLSPDAKDDWPVEGPEGAMLYGAVIVLGAACVAGVGLHYYDKLRVNQFAGGCLAAIRGAWTTASALREGAVSSWQSAVGHVLSHTAFPLVSILILQRERLNNRVRYGLWGVAVTSVVLYAGLISTRTPVLSLVMCVVLTYGLRWSFSDEPAGSYLRKNWWGGLVIAAIAVLYASVIFRDRMHCNEGYAVAPTYEQSFCKELSAEGYVVENRSDAVRNPLMFGIYLSNSSWNFERILHTKPTSFPSLTSPLSGLLERAHFMGRSSSGMIQRACWHGLLSMPGAAWYEFGTEGC